MLRRLILPVLLTFAAVAAVAPSAHAAKGLEVGMQDDSVLVNHYWGSAPQAYARAKQLHASWVRVLVPWASTMTPQQARAKKKPKHITYNWAGFDAMIKDAHARGFHVQLVLTGASPAWASGDHKVNGINSVSPNAREYGKWTFTGGQALPRQKVTRYSIYNEVNHFGYLRPTGRKTLAKQATMYRNLYANGYKNIRRAYPKAQIFFGELAPYAKKGQSYSPLAFLRAVLCVNGNYKKRSKKCPKFVADGFAQHPYDNYHRRRGKDDVTMNSLGHLTSALDKLAKLGALRKHGHGKLSVYLTEFGYFSRTAQQEHRGGQARVQAGQARRRRLPDRAEEPARQGARLVPVLRAARGLAPGLAELLPAPRQLRDADLHGVADVGQPAQGPAREVARAPHP